MGTKVVCPSPPITVTKVGYIAIFKAADYGSRVVDADNPTLFESKQECNDCYEGNVDFVGVAKVTWEEPA